MEQKLIELLYKNNLKMINYVHETFADIYAILAENSVIHLNDIKNDEILNKTISHIIEDGYTVDEDNNVISPS